MRRGWMSALLPDAVGAVGSIRWNRWRILDENHSAIPFDPTPRFGNSAGARHDVHFQSTKMDPLARVHL
jgi:hypothetical protein